MKIVYCMKINQMKHIFTLLTLALMSSVSAQTVLPPNYPFNPDSDGDEFVAVSDVLMSVASYDNEFQAQSIMIDTLSLEEAIQMLLQQQSLNQQALIQSQQALIQSQQDLIDGLTNSLAGVEGFDSCPLQWSCGCPWTYQGHDYATVQIGEQCWFAENLRSENYKNGDAIPAGLGNSGWDSINSGASAVYEESASNLETYGRLYNWYAVDDARGLCPSGWHVPTDGEWTVLTDHLGGESVAGVQMKASYGWSGGDNGTNSSGFSGLPGGLRNSDGYFYYAGGYGYWWSSSPIGSYAWYRNLFSSNEDVYRGTYDQRRGFSVRCVLDAE